MSQKHKINLSSSFSLRGKWFIEDSSPDLACFGELFFNPEGETKLVLSTPASIPATQKNFTIYGLVESGECCTLLDCFAIDESLAYTASNFVFNKLFLGDDTVEDSSKYKSLVVSLPNLDNWLGIRSVNIDSTPSLKNNVNINFLVHKNYCVRVNKIDASIRFIPFYSVLSENGKTTLCHETRIEIVPKRKESLDWYWMVLSHLRTLLHLFIGEPLKIRKMVFKTRVESKGVEYCATLIQNHSFNQIHRTQMPYPYSGLKYLRQSLNSWFDKKELLNHLCELYYGVVTSSSMPLEFQFIALTQALEAYHRETGEDKYIDEDSYESVRLELIDSIPDEIDKDLRASLKSRILYGNEYSLRKRLNLILNQLPKRVTDKILEGEACAQFVNKIIDTRNFLTHRDIDLEYKAMDFRGVYNTCEKLKIIIEFILLTESGAHQGRLEDEFCEGRYYRRRFNKKIGLL